MFQAAKPYDAQQQLVSGVQNLNMNDDKTPLMSAPQVSAQPELNQSAPPPFLSGVPMVNPGNFGAQGGLPPTSVTGQPIIPQQPVGQQINPSQPPASPTQSVVSNMAAYSSSKYSYSDCYK